MARFRFKLESLLKVRQAAEDERQREVAALESKKRELEDRLARQQQAIDRGRAGLRHQLSGELEMSDLRAQAGAVNQARRAAEAIAVELAAIMQKGVNARAALREAMAERRAIELLKERRLHEWKSRAERAEQASMDELAVINAARQEANT